MGLLSPQAKLVFLPTPALSPLSAVKGTGFLCLCRTEHPHPSAAGPAKVWVQSWAPWVLTKGAVP